MFVVGAADLQISSFSSRHHLKQDSAAAPCGAVPLFTNGDGDDGEQDLALTDGGLHSG